MKKKWLLFLLCLFINQIAFSQSGKLYVVINEATWCPYCKANGQRVRNVIDGYSSKNKEVVVIHNDVSNEVSRKKMFPEFKKLGILDYISLHKEAAMVYVFDAKAKKNVDGFYITLSDQEILAKLQWNLKKVESKAL
jgi:hypothetical protein